MRTERRDPVAAAPRAGQRSGGMVLLNVSPRDETDGRTADERADGRTGGRADERTDGRGHCGRGTGRGMRTVRRDPAAAASRAPAPPFEPFESGFARGAGRGPRPPPPPPPSPPLSAQYTHGLTPAPAPSHPPTHLTPAAGTFWREGNFESHYLRDCRCGFETRGGVEELPFILVSETRHDAGATGGGAADFTGGAADSTRGRLCGWAMTAAR